MWLIQRLSERCDESRSQGARTCYGNLLPENCAYREFKSADGSWNAQTRTSLDKWSKQWIGFEDARNRFGECIQIKKIPAALLKHA